MTATENDIAALEAIRDRIEADATILSAALAERDNIAAQCRMRQASQQIAIGELNPSDSKAITALARERGELEVLQAWVAAAPKVRAAAEMLRASLVAAVLPIQNVAQFRSAEESLISSCHWRSGLERLNDTLEDRARALCGTAKSVVGEIEVVLSAKRPIILSEDERRSDVLRDCNHTVIRRLTPQEKLSGLAYE
jgi:hypothetical protein